jgi:hypothetical protein
MAMKPRRFSTGGSVVNLGAAGFQSPPSGSDTTVGDPDFGAEVDAQNKKNKENMKKPPPPRKPPKSESEPVRKMRGGGMVKKMRGGGMVKKMRGGGMVKKMRGGGMVKKK